jgi:hypothetical protein
MDKQTRIWILLIVLAAHRSRQRRRRRISTLHASRPLSTSRPPPKNWRRLNTAEEMLVALQRHTAYLRMLALEDTRERFRLEVRSAAAPGIRRGDAGAAWLVEYSAG